MTFQDTLTTYTKALDRLEKSPEDKKTLQTALLLRSQLQDVSEAEPEQALVHVEQITGQDQRLYKLGRKAVRKVNLGAWRRMLPDEQAEYWWWHLDERDA